MICSILKGADRTEESRVVVLAYFPSLKRSVNLQHHVLSVCLLVCVAHSNFCTSQLIFTKLGFTVCHGNLFNIVL